MYKIIPLLLILSINWVIKLTEYIEMYVFQDWGFVKYLFIMVFLDTILGVRRSIIQKTFYWRNLNGLKDKLIVYISILVLVHVMTSFTVNDETVTWFSWLRISVFSGLMAKEGFSSLKNIAATNKSYVPVWLLKRFEEWDKTGKFKLDGNDRTDEDKKVS